MKLYIAVPALVVAFWLGQALGADCRHTDPMSLRKLVVDKLVVNELIEFPEAADGRRANRVFLDASGIRISSRWDNLDGTVTATLANLDSEGLGVRLEKEDSYSQGYWSYNQFWIRDTEADRQVHGTVHRLLYSGLEGELAELRLANDGYEWYFRGREGDAEARISHVGVSK